MELSYIHFRVEKKVGTLKGVLHLLHLLTTLYYFFILPYIY